MLPGNPRPERTRPAAAVYHRLETSTQTRHTAALQQASGEIWGTYDRTAGGRSPFPSVDAFVGALPAGAKGVEFSSDVPPDRNSPPRLARWTGPRDGVIVEGDYAKIKVTITRNTQVGST
jgi:hypothetical protein